MSSPFLPSPIAYTDFPQGGNAVPMIVAGRDPSDSIDRQYAAGYLWLSSLDIVNSDGTTGSGLLFYQAGNTSGSPSWTISSAAAGALNTLSDGSIAVLPLGGNIAIVGTSQQIVSMSSPASHEIILSVPTNFVAPGSISSTTTLTVGSDLTVNHDATISNDLTVTNDVSVGGNLSVTGTITFSGLTVAGTVNLNVTGNAATNIGNAAGSGSILIDVPSGDLQINGNANEIHIGDDANANVVVLGSSNTTASTHIQAGTGDLLLDGSTTAAIILGSVTQTGTITIGRSTAGQNIDIGSGINASAQVITIANGASAGNTTLDIMSGVGTSGVGVIAFGSNTRVTTVGIANIAPAAARTITIQGGNSAQNDTLNIMNGSPSANTQTVSILSGTASGGTQALNLGNGIGGTLTVSIGNGINSTAQTVNIANGASAANTTLNIMSGIGTAGAGVIAFGSNTRVTTLGICNIAPAAARTITIAGGNQAQNDTVTIFGGAASAGTQTFNLFSGNSAGATQNVNICTGTGAFGINIGTGATGVKTIAIGGTAANVITVGDTQTAGSVSIGNAMTTGTINLGAAVQTGTITIGKATNATGQTINIQSAASIAGANIVNLLSGATPGASQTLNIMTGVGTAGTYAVNILTGNSTGTTQTVSIGTGSAETDITIGGTGANVIAIANTQTGGSLSLAHAMTTGNIVIGDAQTSGTLTIGSTAAGTGAVRIVDGTGQQTVTIATGAGIKTVTLGSTNSTSALTLQAGTGATGLKLSAAGNVQMVPATQSVASPTASATQNTRVAVLTFTGFTTASAGTQAFTITDSAILATSGIICTVSNLVASGNDAQMSLVGIKQAAGSMVVQTKNNGTQALGAGDNVLITYWIIS